MDFAFQISQGITLIYKFLQDLNAIFIFFMHASQSFTLLFYFCLN